MAQSPFWGYNVSENSLIYLACHPSRNLLSGACSHKAVEMLVCIRVTEANSLIVRDGNRVVGHERASPHERANLRLGRILEERYFPSSFGATT